MLFALTLGLKTVCRLFELESHAEFGRPSTVFVCWTRARMNCSGIDLAEAEQRSRGMHHLLAHVLLSTQYPVEMSVPLFHLGHWSKSGRTAWSLAFASCSGIGIARMTLHQLQVVHQSDDARKELTCECHVTLGLPALMPVPPIN